LKNDDFISKFTNEKFFLRKTFQKEMQKENEKTNCKFKKIKNPLGHSFSLGKIIINTRFIPLFFSFL